MASTYPRTAAADKERKPGYPALTTPRCGCGAAIAYGLIAVLVAIFAVYGSSLFR